ncbi:MAG: peptidoglycan DD-metalloendopeptidase family protein, partial [Acetobacteraceae bacterium]|nr:peptidoglycan DD-metalloendopeptidase family protein [Acetobacteraceae bacterium]
REAEAESRRARQAAARPAEARPPEARPPEPRAPDGTRPLPVAGQVLRGFGSPGDGGPAQGLTLGATAQARVVTPCAGRVAYAGPFRSYGRLVIVDCGGGEHVVLAGLDRLDAQGGQRVLAGEPVGTLPGNAPARLYMELRRGGAPVDPRPWLGLRS